MCNYCNLDSRCRGAFEVDGGRTYGSCRSGSVEVDKDSVSGESVTPEELMLIIELEINL
jgi:hypothetical protein